MTCNVIRVIQSTEHIHALNEPMLHPFLNKFIVVYFENKRITRISRKINISIPYCVD